MKRTPPWVFVAAVGVQLAALGLCLWAMEHVLRAEEAAAKPLAPAPEPASADALASVPAPEPGAAVPPPPPVSEPAGGASARSGSVTIRAVTVEELAEQQRYGESAAPPPPPPEPYVFHPEPAPRSYEPEPRPQPAVVRVQATAPGAPVFGPPPVRPPQGPAESNGVPHFIGELADPSTQVVCGRAEGGRFAFGFYPDGNIRFVDVDGGRYTGKAESARARMREVEGARAFTVQIGVAADGRLQATFSGGAHDTQTIALEPLAAGTSA